MTIAGSSPHVMVVGGTGFMGSLLLQDLAACGWPICLVHRAEETQFIPPLPASVMEAMCWEGDLGEVSDLMLRVRPDLVVLLAAHYVAEHAPQDVDPLLAANVRLPVVVMEAARCAGVTRFVTAGTFWEEYSESDLSPVNLYAATRCAAKAILRYYAAANGWAVSHLRVSDLYGPGDPRRKLFYLLRQAVLTGEPLQMSPGEQLIDLVHVADAAGAFLPAAQRTLAQTAPGVAEYGVFSGKPLPLRTVVDIYAEVIGRAVPVEWGRRAYRDREVMVPRTITNVPGWRPRFALEDGLRDMESGPGGLLHP